MSAASPAGTPSPTPPVSPVPPASPPSPRPVHPLRRALALVEVDRRRFAVAVAAGALSLGSSVALAAVSAWLIARASQMPPVLTLSVAAVAVRTFGITRGLMRYVERLVSHAVALRGMTRLRTRLYERLAAGDPAAVVTLRRGDLLARVGADVDAVGDLVVRGLLPAAVAVVVGLGSALAMGLFLPAAGLALLACLLLAGIGAPLLAVRAARTVERRSARARADLAATTMTLLDGAAELRVSGRLAGVLADLRRTEVELAAAADDGGRPAALGAAATPLAAGLAVLAAFWLGGPAVAVGALDPVELAVVVLTPLAVFEAVALLPAGAVQVLRSREAAVRICALLDAVERGPASPATGSEPAVRATGAPHPDAPDPTVDPGTPDPAAPEPAPTPHLAARDLASGRPGRDPTAPDPAAPDPPPAARLAARDLACGWPGRDPVLRGLDLDLTPGARVAVVGPSGVGKTTLLLTLAGMLRPAAGRVTLDGRPVAALPRAAAAAAVAMTAEDAHVFDTTVLENLRVARGDVTPAEAEAALTGVGLGPWLDGLPDGLGTLLGSDAARVSGGERRRLLLARALLGPAPLLLLDEPTEHVDDGGPALLTALLDGTLAPGRGVVVVTHRLAGLEPADEVILLAAGGTVAARGHHHELMAHAPYAAAVAAQRLEP